jgi:TRAP-type mannitol/chloroaromatic compound transport system substrate-binding protein
MAFRSKLCETLRGAGCSTAGMTRETDIRAKAGATGALALVLALSLAPARGGAAEGDTVTLVTPLAYGTHLPGLGRPALTLARTLKKRSGGTLVLDLKQPGDGTLPHEILDKVSDGKVDAGFATAGFWAAKVPAAPLFGGFPFGPDAKGYRAWFDHGHGRKLYQEMYDQAGLKVHVMPCAFGGAEAGGWFVKEIHEKEDFDGLRMRIFGLGARVMSRLGTIPVLVAGGDLPQAFEEGKIGAAELYTPAVDRQEGIQKAVKLLYMPGWHQPATVLELLINKDRWNALGPERRELIETTCRDLLQSSLGESAGLQAAALSSLSTKDGVRILPWPEDVLEALRAAWDEVAKEEGIRDYFFKEVLEDMKRFQAGAAGAASGPATPEPQRAAPAAAAGSKPATR